MLNEVSNDRPWDCQHALAARSSNIQPNKFARSVHQGPAHLLRRDRSIVLQYAKKASPSTAERNTEAVEESSAIQQERRIFGRPQRILT